MIRDGRVRLVHFDLKTRFSYGDQLLFECVREVFNGFRGGACFEMLDSLPLRAQVGPSLVDHLNANYDAVVVGGGGLFLRSSNPNPNSGWQWNISIDQLRRLRIPVIVFAVGNTRFYGQDDFDRIFADHIAATIDASAFFGLRNTGSIETIGSYVDAARRARIELQPCPTTIAGELFPDLVRPMSDDLHLGLQIGLEGPHRESGFVPDVVFPQLDSLVRRLRHDGWRVTTVGHKRTDMEFHREFGAQLGLESIELFRRAEVLFDGLRHYAGLPIVLGARGHAQMIPFGLGNIPLSLRVNPKVEYFARDVGHPDWVIDPLDPDFVDRAHAAITDAGERRHALRDEIVALRARLAATTDSNLAAIFETLTGSPPPTSAFRPYSPFERDLALSAWKESYLRRKQGDELAEERARWRQERAALTLEADALAAELADHRSVAAHLERATVHARAGDLTEARRLIALAEALDPVAASAWPRPRWARPPVSWMPVRVAAAMMRARRRFEHRRSHDPAPGGPTGH